MIREIVKDVNGILRKMCRPVENFDQKLHDLIDDMRETLADANGAGLAAPQVGILRRVVLVLDERDEVLELVNPEILSTEGEQEDFEGCLSIPGYYGIVKRPAIVTVKAQDRNGAEFTVTGTGMTARCFCHEVDHLNGKLFTDLTDKLYTPEEIEQMLERENQEQEG